MPRQNRIESEPFLSVDDLTVTLDGKAVIKNVSLSLAPREVLAAIGPNGSGKAVPLKTLAVFFCRAARI